MGPVIYQHVNSKGQTYYLNAKDVELRNGLRRTIYFFSKVSRPSTGCDLPGGMEVVENSVNNFLVLRKVK